MPLRHAAPSPPQFTDALVGETTIEFDHPIFDQDTVMRTGRKGIEATMRWRRILFAGFMAPCMKDSRLVECVMFGEPMGGAGCVRGQEN